MSEPPDPPPEAYPGSSRQVRPDGPTLHVQWKGTELCADIRCVCGYSNHVDPMVYYYLRCANCDRVFLLNAWVALIELTPAERERFMAERNGEPVPTGEDEVDTEARDRWWDGLPEEAP